VPARDLVVVGADPRFGGGSHAHTQALVEAARALGREPEVVFVPHPTLRPQERLPRLDRVEALRLVRGSRALLPTVREARTVWVAAPLAMHGWAAARSGRPYACWAGASLADERRGRLPALAPSRRVAALLNAPVLERLERTVLRGAEQLFATGEASRSALARAAGLDPGRIGILPLPVDLDRFRPLPDEEWLARLEQPVLAFVGRTDDPRKNLALALEALPLVRERLPAATLRVIGPGRVRSADGVEALGEVASVAEPLREAAVLVLPARQEGFGIAAAEALACGVPVVAAPSGGPEELLRRSGGGIVTGDWEPAGFAAAVLSLLEDVATLSAMRHQGHEYVAREHSPARLQELLAAALADAG
jgi:glycosyltransferase involved in cell wall biosynthesis